MHVEYVYLKTIAPAGSLPLQSAHNFGLPSDRGVPALYPLMSRYEFIEGILNTIVYKNKVIKRQNNGDEDGKEEYDYDEADEECKVPESGRAVDTRKKSVSTPTVVTNTNLAALNQLEIDLEEFFRVNLHNYWNHLNKTSLLYCNTDANVNEDIKLTVMINLFCQFTNSSL